MINVSSEFRELMDARTDFYTNAVITLADGTQITLTESDFTEDGNSIIDGAGTGNFPLGVAVARSVQLEVFNDNERFSSLDFLGARVAVKLKYELSTTTEYIDMGVFTVGEPATYGETVTITAIDDMYRADKAYETKLVYPATLSAMFREACTACGIPFVTLAFPNSEYVVREAPTGDLTYRTVFGYIAMLAGGNARISRFGNMEILPWVFIGKPPETVDEISGGTFEPWTAGDEISGGTFEPWTAGDELSGGSFNPWGTAEVFPENADHTLRDWDELCVDINDISITGVQAERTIQNEDGSELTYMELCGSDGYVLTISNPLIAGDEVNALSLIGAPIVGQTLRKFNGEYRAYPLAEFMDTIAFSDRRGKVYTSVVTDVEFTFLSSTSLENSAESALRVGSAFSSGESPAIVAARKLVNAERTAREAAIAQLNQRLEGSSGLYPTDVKQPDGSVIRYLHDKPTLEESAVVIKVTASGVGVSTDGGKTYPYGATVDGQTIVSILSAEGINADWITSGALTITDDDGNVIFSADKDAQTVVSSAIDTVQAVINSNKSESDSRLDALEELSESNAADIAAANQNAQDSNENLKSTIVELEQRVTSQLTAAQASIDVVRTELEGGAKKVTTTSGVFDENGLTIGRSDSDTSTNIDNDGMDIARRDGEKVLTADSSGVNALNLTARQYLTIGTNSRFEDYMGNRTACFYIGG